MVTVHIPRITPNHPPVPLVILPQYHPFSPSHPWTSLTFIKLDSRRHNQSSLMDRVYHSPFTSYTVKKNWRPFAICSFYSHIRSRITVVCAEVSRLVLFRIAPVFFAWLFFISPKSLPRFWADMNHYIHSHFLLRLIAWLVFTMSLLRFVICY